MWYNLFDAGRGGVIADSLENNLSQVCQFLNGLCLPRLVFKCLIIVPTQSVDLWVSALLQLAPRVRCVEYTGPQRERRFSQIVSLGGVVVTSYGVAMNDIDRLGPNTDDNVWDVIVFDQAERLKDPSSKTNATLSRLQGNVNLLLTSHALLHSPKDLYSLFDFACEADIFGSAAAFRDRFEVPSQRAQSKRADNTDRQLAAVAKAQLADLIDSQYWQNWQDLLTPGGEHVRQEQMVAPTPTPAKARSALAASFDVTSTPSFARARTAPRTTSKKAPATVAIENADSNILSGTPAMAKKTPARSKTGLNNKRVKPLIPEVINLDDDDSPIGIDQLESSLSNIGNRAPQPSSGASSTETPNAKPSLAATATPSFAVIELDLPTPTRRTPIRNTFFATHTPVMTPTAEAASKLAPNKAVVDLVLSPKFSPQVVMERQRLSFGRISLLEDHEHSNPDEDEAEEPSPLLSAFAAVPKTPNGTSAAGTPQREKKKSLATMTWPSVEVFLRQREAYAEKLFAEMNSVIFGGRLPVLLLVWRAMKNCAGIYHYKDSSITLSKTLLTNSSRLASTLAHEMAHAATHLLDECPNDHHGPVWQKWARIGHARYPTVVSGEVYHNYCSQNPGPNSG